MGHNKGFTLVELLTVITIMGLLIVFTFPLTTNVISKVKKQLNHYAYEQLEDAGKLYLQDMILNEKPYQLKASTPSISLNATYKKVIYNEDKSISVVNYGGKSLVECGSGSTLKFGNYEYNEATDSFGEKLTSNSIVTISCKYTTSTGSVDTKIVILGNCDDSKSKKSGDYSSSSSSTTACYNLYDTYFKKGSVKYQKNTEINGYDLQLFLKDNYITVSIVDLVKNGYYNDSKCTLEDYESGDTSKCKIKGTCNLKLKLNMSSIQDAAYADETDEDKKDTAAVYFVIDDYVVELEDGC